MTTKGTKRDANKIVELAKKGRGLSLSGSLFYELFAEIVALASGTDASTGQRDSSTKKRRSKAAKSSVRKAARKRAV